MKLHAKILALLLGLLIIGSSYGMGGETALDVAVATLRSLEGKSGDEIDAWRKRLIGTRELLIKAMRTAQKTAEESKQEERKEAKTSQAQEAQGDQSNSESSENQQRIREACFTILKKLEINPEDITINFASQESSIHGNIKKQTISIHNDFKLDDSTIVELKASLYDFAFLLKPYEVTFDGICALHKAILERLINDDELYAACQFVSNIFVNKLAHENFVCKRLGRWEKNNEDDCYPYKKTHYWRRYPDAVVSHSLTLFWVPGDTVVVPYEKIYMYLNRLLVNANWQIDVKIEEANGKHYAKLWFVTNNEEFVEIYEMISEEDANSFSENENKGQSNNAIGTASAQTANQSASASATTSGSASAATTAACAASSSQQCACVSAAAQWVE